MGLLSSMFCKGKVRAIRVTRRLNVSDIITKASVDPIGTVNSPFYREGKLPTGECLTDLLGSLQKRIHI